MIDIGRKSVLPTRREPLNFLYVDHVDGRDGCQANKQNQRCDIDCRSRPEIVRTVSRQLVAGDIDQL